MVLSQIKVNQDVDVHGINAIATNNANRKGIADWLSYSISLLEESVVTGADR